MKKGSPIKVTVVSARSVTKNMQRIVFQGDEIAHFPSDCEGGYIKLLFDQAGKTDLSGMEPGVRPIMRTYTIHRFDKENSTLEVDFVRHPTDSSEGGFACNWASRAKQGDQIFIAGPGVIQGLNLNADWFFLVGDMTALPAISVKLKSLPANAKGYALVETASEEDKQPLEAPEGIEVEWLIRSQSQTSRLSDVAVSKNWLEGRAAVWCACEFDSMRVLRNYFRNQQQVNKEELYISSYWKNGVTEDGHKLFKRKYAEDNQS